VLDYNHNSNSVFSNMSNVSYDDTCGFSDFGFIDRFNFPLSNKITLSVFNHFFPIVKQK
jgi:hypothetical protein